MVSEFFNFASFAFAALFFIVDPIGNVPLFLAITPKNDFIERKQIVGKSFDCQWVDPDIFSSYRKFNS